MTYQIYFASGGTSGPFNSKVGALANGISLLLRSDFETYIDVKENEHPETKFRLYRNGQFADFGGFLSGIRPIFHEKNGLLEHLKGEET